MTGTVKVNRAELARALAAQGVNPDIAMKGRITINAVVRRACEECGLPQMPTPEQGVHCCCEGGPAAEVVDLGVIADSGPRSLFPRAIWKLKQTFRGAFA